MRLRAAYQRRAGRSAYSRLPARSDALLKGPAALMEPERPNENSEA
jgi:hypothetical protein